MEACENLDMQTPSFSQTEAVLQFTQLLVGFLPRQSRFYLKSDGIFGGQEGI